MRKHCVFFDILLKGIKISNLRQKLFVRVLNTGDHKKIQVGEQEVSHC